MNDKSNNNVIIAIIICSMIMIVLFGAAIFYLLTHNSNNTVQSNAEQNTAAVVTEAASAAPTAIPVTAAPANNVPVYVPVEVPVEVPAANSGSGDTTTKYTMYVVNCQEWISLRESPSTSAKRLTKINLGESCGFIEKSSNGFSKIAYNGMIGYALDQYLSTEKPSASTGRSDVMPRATDKMRVVNCKEYITLRPSDNVNSGEITKIPLGAVVEYLGPAGNGFYKVRYNGSTGYALSQYLTPHYN